MNLHFTGHFTCHQINSNVMEPKQQDARGMRDIFSLCLVIFYVLFRFLGKKKCISFKEIYISRVAFNSGNRSVTTVFTLATYLGWCVVVLKLIEGVP